MKFFSQMPLSSAGSGQGIECGLVRSLNVMVEHVHLRYCDSRQPASLSVPFSKAVALNEPALDSSRASEANNFSVI